MTNATKLTNPADKESIEGIGKIEVIKGTAEKLRELNAARVASVVAPAQPIVGAPVLMPETQEQYQAAVAALKAAAAAEHERLKDSIAIVDAENDFFVKCRYMHGANEEGIQTAQHGIYLTKNPGRGEVKWNEWFATYKAPTARHNGEIICQVCFGNGNKMKGSKYVPLPLTFTQAGDGSFTIDERWLWKRHRATGVETRVLMTRLNSANEWVDRTAAAKKVAV